MITNYREICVLCGRPKQETHHLIFGMSLRELADEDKLYIPLCAKCHKALHYNGTASGMSKIIGQLQWEQDALNVPQERRDQIREDFRKRYGRSYL